MSFWSAYGLFLAKAFTFVLAVVLLFAIILSLLRASKETGTTKISIKKLNKKYEEFAETLKAEIWSKSERKTFKKSEKKKKEKVVPKKRLFVLEFLGDIKASAVNHLREEITAILTIAKPSDEVVLCLESHGGMVSPYGLAASQLKRLKEKKIPLTIIIDKIAASGGYLMACVADRILAAPFAIIGSIGVVAQIPNLHRFLKKRDVDFELLTAGEYKRTLTIFGENTEKGREKFQEELEEVHTLFKDFILENRAQVDIKKVATGEHWLAAKALELKLVDKLITSDDYLMGASERADLYEVHYQIKKSFFERINSAWASLWHVTPF